MKIWKNSREEVFFTHKMKEYEEFKIRPHKYIIFCDICGELLSLGYAYIMYNLRKVGLLKHHTYLCCDCFKEKEANEP